LCAAVLLLLLLLHITKDMHGYSFDAKREKIKKGSEDKKDDREER
jgi:hypothetical protein